MDEINELILRSQALLADMTKQLAATTQRENAAIARHEQFNVEAAEREKVLDESIRQLLSAIEQRAI